MVVGERRLIQIPSCLQNNNNDNDNDQDIIMDIILISLNGSKK